MSRKPVVTFGEIIAAWTMAQTDGKVNALVLGPDEITPTAPLRDAILGYLETNCPDCKTTYINVPVSFPLTEVDVTVNMLSLFGFILVLGIVVDDAIVIGESAYTNMRAKGHSVDNIVEGVLKVAVPATFGVLTTIAAFLPILLVTGCEGLSYPKPALSTALAHGKDANAMKNVIRIFFLLTIATVGFLEGVGLGGTIASILLVV